MRKPNYSSRSATELLNYAEHIFQKMSENAGMFPDPAPSMTVLEDRLTDYREAYAEATHRDMRAVVLKGQKGKELQEVLYRLSHYVDAVAKGDPAVILAAGYRPSKSKLTRSEATPKATGLDIRNLAIGSGLLKVRVKPWKPARLYQFEHRKKGTEEWQSTLHSNSTMEIGGLGMYQEYEFRASYIGIDTMLNFSDIVTAVVV